MCDLVKKSEGGPCFFFREGGAIGMGVHWHGGGVGWMVILCGQKTKVSETSNSNG